MLSRRGIRWLFHFTPRQNLASIAKHGLIGYREQEELGLAVVRPDADRFDGGKDEFICCSIAQFNFFMFREVLGRTRTTASHFALIRLRAELLLEKPGYFVPWNASSSQTMITAQEDPDAFHGGVALERMFDRSVRFRTGQRLGSCVRKPTMPDYTPTNAQAEVLVKGPIEPHWIDRVLVTPDFERSVADLNWDVVPSPFSEPAKDQRADWRILEEYEAPDQANDDHNPF